MSQEKVSSKGLRPALLVLAAGITLGLLWTATNPAPGQIFYGTWHYLAHLAAFAVLAIVWVLALPQVRGVALMLALVAFAFAHEGIEVLGHMHGYELLDALVDSAGVVAGVAALRLLRLAAHRAH